jgi:hypothetical protein
MTAQNRGAALEDAVEVVQVGILYLKVFISCLRIEVRHLKKHYSPGFLLLFECEPWISTDMESGTKWDEEIEKTIELSSVRNSVSKHQKIHYGLS